MTDDTDKIQVMWTRAVACTAVLSVEEARVLYEDVAGKSYADNEGTAEDLVSALALLATVEAHELGEALDRDFEPSIEYTEGISDIEVSVRED